PRGTKLVRDWISSFKSTVDNADATKFERLRKEQRFVLDIAPIAAKVDATHATETLSSLLKSPSGALAVVDEAESGRFQPHLRLFAIELGYSHADPAIRDLFERFIPEEQ